MKIFLKCIPIFFLISLTFNLQSITAESETIKVLDIESSTIIKEQPNSSVIDKEVENAIRSIKRVTVQANPVPKRGYIIKVPLTKSLKIKNKWFEDIVTEVLLIYNPSTKKQGKIILYNDENTPMFFDIEYNFTPMFKRLSIVE